MSLDNLTEATADAARRARDASKEGARLVDTSSILRRCKVIEIEESGAHTVQLFGAGGISSTIIKHCRGVDPGDTPNVDDVRMCVLDTHPYTFGTGSGGGCNGGLEGMVYDS